MIYTCTVNPSLDYYMNMDKPLKIGGLNRSSSETYTAGGKGINVSIVLNNLGIPNRALGFLGGFSKDFYISLLSKYTYIEPLFNSVKGNTRINVKINGETMTELNAEGPAISEERLNLLIRKFDRLDDHDILVFSGACPSYLKEKLIISLNSCLDRHVKVVFDCDNDVITSCLGSHPFLISMTLDELSDYMKKEIREDKDIVEAIKGILDKGAQNVMIRVTHHSYLGTKDGIYVSDDVEGKTINEIGASSSAIAGFIMQFNRSHDIMESFKYANSAAAATAFEQGLGSKEMIEALVNKIVVTKR